MIDITIPISPAMPTWPGEQVSIVPLSRIARGDPANVSRYRLSSHTGTHVDPPFHFIPTGITVDQLPLDTLIGPARVVSLEQVPRAIGAADLAGAAVPPGAVRLLLKTRNSRFWAGPPRPFRRDYVYLADDGAQWLIDHGVRLVGIDYLSIEGFHAPGHPVHHALLAHGIVIVEGLNLAAAAPGDYQLICLPLKVEHGDGAPARAVLM